MGKRIVVNAGVTETRLAVQDGNLLTELYIERADRRSIVGNIYKGVVTNVLPGMQAAFVDIGLAKDAFLYAGDYTAQLGAEDQTAPPAEEPPPPPPDVLISALMRAAPLRAARFSSARPYAISSRTKTSRARTRPSPRSPRASCDATCCRTSTRSKPRHRA